MYESQPDYRFTPGYTNVGVNTLEAPLPDAYKYLAKKWPEPEGDVLKAWDPVTQKERWRVKLPTNYNGGILSTNGNLVFEGSSSGTLHIFRADTGEKLKEIETGTGIMAAPIAYTVDDEQYIAVMAGFGGALVAFPDENAALNKYRNTGRILAFKLDGGPTPFPPARKAAPAVPAPPDMKLDEKEIAQGQKTYALLCAACHASFGEKHFSEFPDLSLMSQLVHDDFRNIVLRGSRSFYGMANFSDVVTEKEADALHQYLVSVQRERYAQAQLVAETAPLR
jgi:quinohemoprotein ethanol dehydrogenase